ncbi:hypothetical protein D1AOALGA4SA_12849 [Olavius algarvensis Delta 1 endosymbiont]|nr:hypothetical protein D1AOALGA4SA_12849 [Olavius algarvensis Delta 1 endosymbiont]
MKIGHGFNLGIQGFRNIGIEGILPIVSFFLSNELFKFIDFIL